MPYGSNACLALLVPSLLLLWAAMWLDVRSGHATMLKLMQINDSRKSHGGMV